MSDASATVPQPDANADLPFEQQIFTRSPFGTLSTAAILLVLFFGSFVAVALVQGVPFSVSRTMNSEYRRWRGPRSPCRCSAAPRLQCRRFREAGKLADPQLCRYRPADWPARSRLRESGAPGKARPGDADRLRRPAASSASSCATPRFARAACCTGARWTLVRRNVDPAVGAVRPQRRADEGRQQGLWRSIARRAQDRPAAH